MHLPISTSLTLSPLTFPHAPPPSMSFLRHLAFPHSTLSPHKLLKRHFISAALKTDTLTPPWTQTPITNLTQAADSLYSITLSLSSSPSLASSYTLPGQYLQLRLPSLSSSSKPAFLAIASPPSLSSKVAEFEFLVKSVPGSTAEVLCGLKEGDVVEIGPVMGNGFDLEKISPPEECQSVLIFATGSGISPIRALIESGFNADKRSDVRLYYGARNLQRMAYQDKFEYWESTGVKIVPVLSQPDEGWTGETGYVQAAFSKSKNISSPNSTGVVLCGQKQMTEEIISILTADGVSSDKILKNF